MSAPAKVSVGKHSYLCNPIYRGNANNITIGNFCSIAEGVVFDRGFNHNYKNVTTFPLNKLDGQLPSNIKPPNDITIGNDVWIGEGALIMSGVTIGDGAVIGFRAIITKDVEPYSMIVSANRVIGKRFAEDQIKRLQKIAWWDWEDERILKNAHLLLSEDIENFLFNHD